MRVVSVPARLKSAAFALALSVPLAGLEAVLSARAPWWRLPYRSAGYAMIAAALTCIPVVYGMFRGKRWTLHVLRVIGGAWSLFVIVGAARAQEPLLGLFAVLSMAYWLGLSMWIEHEMERSFYNPRIRWYQRVPKPIPGLECKLSQDVPGVGLRVSRLDEDGVFVFSDGRAAALRGGKPVEFMLSYRDRQVKCQGYPIVSLPSHAGYGFQFEGMSADERKILGDFVEILRGEGHV